MPTGKYGEYTEEHIKALRTLLNEKSSGLRVSFYNKSLTDTEKNTIGQLSAIINKDYANITNSDMENFEILMQTFINNSTIQETLLRNSSNTSKLLVDSLKNDLAISNQLLTNVFPYKNVGSWSNSIYEGTSNLNSQEENSIKSTIDLLEAYRILANAIIEKRACSKEEIEQISKLNNDTLNELAKKNKFDNNDIKIIHAGLNRTYRSLIQIDTVKSAGITNYAKKYLNNSGKWNGNLKRLVGAGIILTSLFTLGAAATIGNTYGEIGSSLWWNTMSTFFLPSATIGAVISSTTLGTIAGIDNDKFKNIREKISELDIEKKKELWNKLSQTQTFDKKSMKTDVLYKQIGLTPKYAYYLKQVIEKSDSLENPYFLYGASKRNYKKQTELNSLISDIDNLTYGIENNRNGALNIIKQILSVDNPLNQIFNPILNREPVQTTIVEQVNTTEIIKPKNVAHTPETNEQEINTQPTPQVDNSTQKNTRTSYSYTKPKTLQEYDIVIDISNTKKLFKSKSKQLTTLYKQAITKINKNKSIEHLEFVDKNNTKVTIKKKRNP